MATKKIKPAQKPAPKAQQAKGRPVAELTDLEKAFAREYVKTLNRTQAYIACKPGTKNESARVLAARLFAKVTVQDEIARLAERAAKKAEISAQRVLMDAWNVLTADPRQLSEVRAGCCRHCWGKNYRWQFTDGELADAETDHAQRLAMAGTDAQRRKIGNFDQKGGAGFNRRREPNPDCPSCAGEGDVRTVFHDTRNLGEEAVALFAGVKQTKEGFEVKTHSKDAARDALFRHFALYKDRLDITLPTVIVKDLTGRQS